MHYLVGIPINKDAGGIRKIRWKTGKGGGKRGALRVLYYYDGEQLVLLVTLFKKSDQVNIDAGEMCPGSGIH